MTAAITTIQNSGTLAEMLERLGSVPPERIRLHPPPGTATEQDVLACDEAQKHLCELVDGVLVWYVDPESRTARVYTAVDQCTVVSEDQTLDGGAVLPGFSLRLGDWSSQAGQRRAR